MNWRQAVHFGLRVTSESAIQPPQLTAFPPIPDIDLGPNQSLNLADSRRLVLRVPEGGSGSKVPFFGTDLGRLKSAVKQPPFPESSAVGCNPDNK